jgi:integrase
VGGGEKRILNEKQTEAVLGLLNDPNLLVCETCVDTGTRISEMLGLKVKHVDLEKGCIHIVQRNLRGDIAKTKTDRSKRILSLGKLTEPYPATHTQIVGRFPAVRPANGIAATGEAIGFQ